MGTDLLKSDVLGCAPYVLASGAWRYCSGHMQRVHWRAHPGGDSLPITVQHPKAPAEKQAAKTQQHGKDEVTDAAGGRRAAFPKSNSSVVAIPDEYFRHCNPTAGA
jgi:hypothetical protein